MGKKAQGLIMMALLPLAALGQATTGSLTGRVTDGRKNPLQGASIKCSQPAMGVVYFGVSNKNGYYVISNLPPGGSYVLEVSYAGYDTNRQNDIAIQLGEEASADVVMRPGAQELQKVTVTILRKQNVFSHNGVAIPADKLEFLPGRDMYEHLRSIPQAKLQEGNEGAVSFAGQNNRFNALYVDGAVNNDVFGLSASGTNGGQAAVSLLPLESIAQYQVSMSPFDVSTGNFTGAAINAVTRSGTNQRETSAYHYFSNRVLAGKQPMGNDGGGNPNSFFTRTYGMRMQGPVVFNKAFYFVNIEWQRDVYPQAFSLEAYKGNTKTKQLIDILANTVRGTYHYDPGTYLDNPESVNADRIVARMDWNWDAGNSLSISGRYTYAQRMNTNASNENTIHFSNDGYAMLSGTVSGSAEWRRRFSRFASNMLLFTFTSAKDDREPLYKPFPRVRINDGEGAFLLGTDNSSTINLLKQQNWSVTDKYRVTAGAHIITMGLESEHSNIYNAFIQNAYGYYSYATPGDFLTNARPSAYQRGFSETDKVVNDYTNAAARFAMLRTSLFVNDEIRSGGLTMQWGLRADKHFFPTTPQTNEYVNTVALPVFAQHWDVADAGSGAKIDVPVTLSPRVGFVYRVPMKKITWRGGAGVFAGRMPLAWPGGVFTNNGLSVGGFSAGAAQLQKIRFIADPYHQWSPENFGITPNKEPLNLLSKKFSMPSLWRTSLSAEKKWGEWTATAEAMYSKNITEIQYTNLNLIAPTAHAEGSDERSAYSAVNNARPPLHADGSNPFDYAILLRNNKNNTGYAYDFSVTLNGPVGRHWKLDISYHYGRSYVNQEGTSSVNLTQWRTMETVNGRNLLTRSVSDFSAGHRIFAVFTRGYRISKYSGANLSFIYTGESGAPVSYVYDGSMTRDDGPFGAYDLIYVPTQNELQNMLFLPNTVNGITYSSDAQKEALNRFIENDNYLRKRRGSYAERNGSRLPFTHVVDLRFRYEIRIKRYKRVSDDVAGWLQPLNRSIRPAIDTAMVNAAGKKSAELPLQDKGSSPGMPGPTRRFAPPVRVQLTFDLFNFTSFVSPELGRRYFQLNDNVQLIEFAGYAGQAGLTPQFRFDPTRLKVDKWQVSASTVPVYSATWTGRIGCRLLF